MVAYSYSVSDGTATSTTTNCSTSYQCSYSTWSNVPQNDEADNTGPTGAPARRIIAPRRINPVSRVFQMNRVNRWLALLRENNSRRG